MQNYYSAIKKNKILPFAAWMDLKGIILSEISQRKANAVWFHLYVESQKYNKPMIYQKRSRFIYREQIIGYQCWEGRRGGYTGAGQWETQTTGYKMGSRMYHTIQGRQPIFCNNCKWKVTYNSYIKMFKSKNNYSSKGRRSNQSILKEINPEYSLEGLMSKLKRQCFGHLMRRAYSLEKTLMLGKTEGKRRSGWQRMRRWDSITDSMDMNLSKVGR